MEPSGSGCSDGNIPKKKAKIYKKWEDNRIKTVSSAPPTTELYRIKVRKRKIASRKNALYQALSKNEAPLPQETEFAEDEEADEDEEAAEADEDSYNELHLQIYGTYTSDSENEENELNEEIEHLESIERDTPKETVTENENQEVFEESSADEETDDEYLAESEENEAQTCFSNYERVRTLHDYTEYTVDEAVYDLFSSQIKFNRTDRDLKETLKNYSKALPKGHRMPLTPYKFYKYVDQIAPPPTVTKHFYCSTCELYVGSDYQDCQKCNGKKEDLCIFFDIDIIHQVRTLFEDLELAKYLNKSKEGTSKIITDVTSGSEYKRVNSRKDRGPFDLTLIVNTDGVSVIKSSTNHCWPVFCSIMELPYEIRNHNIMFVGLWFDKSIKPAMEVFLKPFAEKLKIGFEKGIKWKNRETGKDEISRIVAPCIVADAPARADVGNVLRYNGKQGCNVCEFSMTTLEGGKIRVYLYPTTFILRTKERMLEYAKKAEILNKKSRAKKKKNVQGVKGKSVLSEFPLLDIAKALLPEIMHSVFLGIVKQFLFVWFFKDGAWSLKSFMKHIDKIIKELKAPSTLHRPPRPLSEFKNYKAAEFLNFLLFFIVPIVSTFLPEKYFKHWLLLMDGIKILMQEEISQTDLKTADDILKAFVQQVPDLYGKNEMTYNLHQLIHLTLTVERWGPLHHIWAFPFENLNHIFTKSIHGTRNYGVEITNKLTKIHQLTVFKWKIFRNSVKRRPQETFLATKKPVVYQFSNVDKTLLESKHIDLNNLVIHSEMKVKGKIFTSTFSKPMKTNNYTVELSIDNESTYGEIEIFFLHGEELFFILQPFKINPLDFFSYEINKEKIIIDYLIPVLESSETEKLLIRFSELQMIDHVVRVTDYVFRPLSVAKKDL